MNVLIVGNGGREHALAWKAKQSSIVERVYIAKGNAGTKMEADINSIDIDPNDKKALADFAIANHVLLTIVGPENPLADGIVDYFEAKGLKCFGPTQAAAQLESSKAFSKDFLKKYNIPTAAYEVFSETDKAITYIKNNATNYPIVLKADGLAAGKGVIIAEDEAQAVNAIKDMLEGNKFGNAGARVVIEEFLQGEEVSFICIADGLDSLPMATSQDHKRRDDGDAGPNTGGMGAYSPSPLVDDAMHQKIIESVITPTLKGMLNEGIHYRGFLYAGLMIAEDGIPKVLEFNCRFGDPETQPIMMRLQSDLVAHCLAAIDGTLNCEKAQWDDRVALGVVMASKNYPEDVVTGDIIDGLDCADCNSDVKIFHAGTTTNEKDQVVSSGGRVLSVVALGETVSAAQRLSYEYCQKISWKNHFYRHDIGYRAIAKENKLSRI